MNGTVKQSFLGFLRHVLTTAGGSAVAAGWIGDSDLVAVVGGIVVLAGVAWSFAEKWLRERNKVLGIE